MGLSRFQTLALAGCKLCDQEHNGACSPKLPLERQHTKVPISISRAKPLGRSISGHWAVFSWKFCCGVLSLVREERRTSPPIDSKHPKYNQTCLQTISGILSLLRVG